MPVSLARQGIVTIGLRGAAFARALPADQRNDDYLFATPHGPLTSMPPDAGSNSAFEHNGSLGCHKIF